MTQSFTSSFMVTMVSWLGDLTVVWYVLLGFVLYLSVTDLILPCDPGSTALTLAILRGDEPAFISVGSLAKMMTSPTLMGVCFSSSARLPLTNWLILTWVHVRWKACSTSLTSWMCS